MFPTPPAPPPPADNPDPEEILLAAVDELFPRHFRPGERPNDLADYKLGPVAIHERWQSRLAAGDPYAREVGAAAERWQAEKDALMRDLRRLNSQLKDAMGRGDSSTAHRIDREIQRVRSELRAARRGGE